jgi:hypothetical protein
MFYIFNFIVLNLIIVRSQLNLYYTNLLGQNNNLLQYNCLRLVINSRESGRNEIEQHFHGNDISSNKPENYFIIPEIDKINQEIMFYCMNEYSSKFDIEEKENYFSKLTFEELAKEKISIKQLYLWSASFDLIENYQFYLNKFDFSLSKEIFYNCTLPRFGPQCQYQFDYHYSNFDEIVDKYYKNNEYEPNTLTCYKHLNCSSLCLDWSEICDGKMNCLNGGQDEEHCWQLEINECNDNEYRCFNGQCIPKKFYEDGKSIFDCLDASDEIFRLSVPNECDRNRPTVACEDRICKENSLTSSCNNKRNYLLIKSLFSLEDKTISEECWFAIKCIFNELSCKDDLRLKTFIDTCPEMFYIPNYPIVFGHTYIAVKKSDLNQILNGGSFPLYICYNHYSYDTALNKFSEILFNNRTCVKSDRFRPAPYASDDKLITKYYKFLVHMYTVLNQYRLILNYTSIICNQSNMYQCFNSSKCILIDRFFDSYNDCPLSDDESMFTTLRRVNITKLNKTHFYCQSERMYFLQSFINDGYCDCPDYDIHRCTDENVGIEDSSKDILFQTICDGFQELLPIVIQNKTHTDETECEKWECDNVYTHCDGVWNCLNGLDEIGCDSLSRSMCSLNQHVCISLLTYRLICLDINKVNDGNLDCIGGTDEPRRIIHPPRVSGGALYYNPSHGLLRYEYKFACMNQTISPEIVPSMLCDGHNACNYGDDEKFCVADQTRSNTSAICFPKDIPLGYNTVQLLCAFLGMKFKRSIIYFKVNNFIKSRNKINENVLSSSISPQEKNLCHRGLNLRINEINLLCLCPPSYYGDNCQYQNERLSLAIQFQSLSDSWQTQLAIIISLIDDSDQRIIHSYEQINYFVLKKCRTKYQFNLLYSTRPKDSTKNYSIHIDFYEKKSLIHRGSLLFPILFPFLPVYRLALIVDIPRIMKNEKICSNEKCNHGKCIKYSNTLKEITFCQCDEGWSGKYCHIQFKCTCSSDSLCLGISAINNRSICICPLNKFGPRCFLTVQINNYTRCENGGEYIRNNDDDKISDEQFLCICPNGYSGDRCEIVDNQINLSFDKNITLLQDIFIHFIEVIENASHIRSTTFRRISFVEDIINITWSKPFHIVFVDISNHTYYLILVQNIYFRSRNISKQINPFDRCPHINELFNETFIQWHLIRRIKSYHLPCQNQSLNLSCFYDDIHFCLCYQFGEKRLANCFRFDHNMKFDCSGQNKCENGGQCFQGHPECSTESICICPSCYFGQLCQLTTNGFGLSLDVILGYQIFPHVRIDDQPLIIKLSFALTIILIITGFVNGILSLITFLNETVCEVGCGLYLLSSSITTLLITIMFGLKYFILLYSHMSMITNQTFLTVQCYSFDFILRIFLSLDQWLNACIAIERTITVIKGAGFNKKKSKRTAKLMIIILLIIIIISYIHDPIHRKVIDEIDNSDSRQDRIWCIVNYSSDLKIYNSFIHTFHFLGPFIINFLSVIILILKKTRQQSNLHKQQPYKDILHKTIKEHKQLLTAPIILIILSLPRLILLFISRCMKSAGDVWLFLCGYFISFIPPILTFLIFILPSTFYKDTFRSTIKRYAINILRWFGFIQ